ncbi:MAG: quinone oxidoreductase [Chloroflexaceae bacterium]|nr:quinone oxidoreductase [Chloroflexaceae bacterium]NJO04787.1 quinone oxidoreductase [Chloroflexaceae bacterium]
MYAVRIHETGGPEVLSYEEIVMPEPAAGEVRVKVAAIGINFIDTYHRTGLYNVNLPFTLGVETAGIIDAVGPEVEGLAEGDHVVTIFQPGGYAEYMVLAASKVVRIPAEVDLQVAAAAALQGMTAHYLTRSTFPLQAGQTALIHAAAGGTGLLLVQMAKQAGARVFGTVSTEEKAALARQAGADEVILYTQEDFTEAVKRLTDGAGVDVVYDSVGQTTFEGSLNCLRPRGYMVLFGQSSGPVPPIDLNILNPKGSLYVTRPSLGHYVANADELAWRASDVFGGIAAGTLDVRIGNTFALRDAADAHRALEGRQTTGKVLLIP